MIEPLSSEDYYLIIRELENDIIALVDLMLEDYPNAESDLNFNIQNCKEISPVTKEVIEGYLKGK